MNKMYAKGVRFERDIMRALEARGFAVTRASGSHSAFDVIGYRADQKPLFVQCKTTKDVKLGQRFIEKFRLDTVPSKFYHQALYVKVGRGTSSILEVTL